MYRLNLSADDLIASLLTLSATEKVCILDSCGVGYLGSHLLIAGVRPVEVIEISGDVEETLATLDDRLSSPDLATMFSISYEFGRKLNRMRSHRVDEEHDVFLASFDTLVVHDYGRSETFLAGNETGFDNTGDLILSAGAFPNSSARAESVHSNFSKADYLAAIESIKERIRRGDTYQTNLTRQFTATLPAELVPEEIFWRLRERHPAPFAAIITRNDSTVVSASPERFIRIENGSITTSPIKGTRPRGSTPDIDDELRQQLLASQKDRAENTMIVDLLRNDLGRICEFGTVEVEKLCELEEHPTFFHLVSTVTGQLRPHTSFSDILNAVFPCGSITGAPKISTMNIIDEIERSPRGLSMGAIGYRVPASFGMGELVDLSVAIRTMVVRDNKAVFNVGGGIVIDSDAEAEYEETVTKSKALLNALGVSE